MSNSIKLKVKKGIPQLTIKSQKGQQLCERELYAINNGDMPGLIPVTVIEKGFSNQLVYDLNGYMALNEYVSIPMDKACFTSVLSGILGNLMAIKDAVFNEASVWLDPKHVFVDPQSQNILFLYVPLSSYDCGTDLGSFLQELIQYCTFDPSEDLGYVSGCIELLNKGASFSVFEFEQYVSGLNAELERANRPKFCPKCQMVREGGFAFCCECGTPLVDTDDQMPMSIVSEPAKKVGACLFRESTGERIVVDRPHFRIGKSAQNNDYTMPELRTVSRNHAAIITRDDRYYLIDLGSTNGTFLEGCEITPQAETEIFHGSRVRFANESFVFEINQ